MPTLEAYLAFLSGDRLPVHRATSWRLGAVYPFFSESGPRDLRTNDKARGFPIGHYGLLGNGGVHSFDEFEFYRAGVIHNLNVKVFGQINQRKSGMMKFFLWLASIAGYNTLITDPKGEYTPMLEMVPGSKIMRFGKDEEGNDLKFYINALDKHMDLETQNALIASLAITAIDDGRLRLNVTERNMLNLAIQDAHAHFGSGSTGVATLPVLVEKLFNPSEELAQKMRLKREDLVGRDGVGFSMAQGLMRLTETDLKGMFHKESTVGFFEDCPLLIMNVEGVSGEAAVIATTIINFFTTSMWSRSNPLYRFHRVVHDESWDLAAYPGFVDSVRRSFKLGRTWSVANWVIAHHLNNLNRSGDTDAIKDLISDSDTTISYKQDDAELEKSASELRFTKAEIQRNSKLKAGVAQWKFREDPAFVVKQNVWPEFRHAVETSHLIHGVTDLQRAKIAA
jgi:hypothetical protein